LGNSCFVAGTTLLTDAGEKPIEQFQVGDRILSRPEDNPEGPNETKVVEETFVRTAPILDLRVNGHNIRTTAEHPFYVVGKGWLCAKELQVGDYLASHDGQWVTVEVVTDLREVATVYNLRVSDYHTYFVGSREWGFSVWAHNANCVVVQQAGGRFRLIDVVTGREVTSAATRAEIEAFARQHGHNILAGVTTTPAAAPRGYAPRPQTVPENFNPEAALPTRGTKPQGSVHTGPNQTTGVAVWTDANGRQSMVLTSGGVNSTVAESAAQHRFPIPEPTATPGLTTQNYNHPEGQMAYFMRQNPHIREAEMWINCPTGPCTPSHPNVRSPMSCDPNLNRTLLPGQRLTVRWRDANGQAQVHLFENPGAS
jgi:hypothetical protein